MEARDRPCTVRNTVHFIFLDQLLKVVRYYDRPLRYNQRERTRQARERAQYQKADPLAEPEDDLPHDDEDTSHWDDEHTPETTPEADDEVMYSFDAPRGPTLGEEVLSEAMHKAVARFEDGKTVKLVNDEYDPSV